jgi:hypothetical protein
MNEQIILAMIACALCIVSILGILGVMIYLQIKAAKKTPDYYEDQKKLKRKATIIAYYKAIVADHSEIKDTDLLNELLYRYAVLLLGCLPRRVAVLNINPDVQAKRDTGYETWSLEDVKIYLLKE